MRTLLLIIFAALLGGCASRPPEDSEPSLVFTAPVPPLQNYEPKTEGEWILGPTLKWPLNDSKGDLAPSNRDEGYKLLFDRWKQGKTARLAKDDVAAIRTIISKHLPNHNPKIGSIKKISNREYMVEATWHSGPKASGGLWFVFVKNEKDWVLLGRYYIWIS